MEERQGGILRDYLLSPSPRDLSAEALAALKEGLAGPLLAHRLIPSPADASSTETWLRRAFLVIHRLSLSPFSTQEAIARDLGLRKEELLSLNAALRDSDLAQGLIVDQGQATKYWRNTLIPILESGAMEAAGEGRFQFPFRISVFAGLSCMFRCTFCGRNHHASYNAAAIPSGNEAFKALFREAPKGDPDRLFISGGLEPLTNAGIGDLVSCGVRQGFRLGLYTNAFLLTPRFLSQQEGLWDLDSLRVSFFGVDEGRTRAVTRRHGAFGRVVLNLTEFLKQRKARNSSVKVGLNFVVLPGHAKDVLELAEVIADINREVGGDRQIDFVTLREDFNTPEDEAIGPEERRELVEVFARLRERLERPDLCRLHVDFGYALQPLAQGAVSRPIVMAAPAEIRPKGFPQVCVVIDMLGDVYIYREAGFLDRPGASRYIIGRISAELSLEAVIRDFLSSGRSADIQPGDWRFLDAFDHVVVKFLNQMDADRAFGVPLRDGPIRLAP